MKRLSPLAYNIYRLTPDTKLREQRRFFKLYLTALIVLAFGALVIWKAESNYREGIKRSPGANSGSPQTHYGARITGEKDNQPILEL